jgi:hypothetical protein
MKLKTFVSLKIFLKEKIVCRGRKKGSTLYTEGDFIFLLDTIKEILFTQEKQWETVSEI